MSFSFIVLLWYHSPEKGELALKISCKGTTVKTFAKRSFAVKLANLGESLFCFVMPMGTKKVYTFLWVVTAASRV